MSDGLITLAAPSRASAPEYRFRFLGDPCLTHEQRPVRSLADIPVGAVAAMRSQMARRWGWAKAVGLSACQIGVPLRLCIVTLATQGGGRTQHLLINPVIVERSDEVNVVRESCLSLPEFETTLRRYRGVTIEFLNEGMELRRLALTGLDAQIAQHEIDHLDGKTLVSGLSRQQRRHAERLASKYAFQGNR